MLNLNFLEALNKLDKLNEDIDQNPAESAVEPGDPNSLADVRAAILNGKNAKKIDISKGAWQAVAQNATKASTRLNRSKHWPATLQVLLNGTQVEEFVAAQLASNNKSSILRSAIEQCFIDYADEDWLRQSDNTYTSADAAEDQAKAEILATKKLADGYKLVPDGTHTLIDAGAISGAPDLIIDGTEKAVIKSIEIKATKGKPGNATNFHGAELVLIYVMDTGSWYARFKKDLNGSDDISNYSKCILLNNKRNKNIKAASDNFTVDGLVAIAPANIIAGPEGTVYNKEVDKEIKDNGDST